MVGGSREDVLTKSLLSIMDGLWRHDAEGSNEREKRLRRHVIWVFELCDELVLQPTPSTPTELTVECSVS